MPWIREPELRKKLVARGVQNVVDSNKSISYRTEQVGAKCAQALPAVQGAVGCSAPRREITRRLVCDVSFERPRTVANAQCRR